MDPVLIVQCVLLPVVVIDLMANILHTRSVPGSHRRYVLASVRAVTVLAVPVWALIGLADDLAGGAGPWSLGLDAALLIMGLWVAKTFYDRGDDNWFKGFGRRFRRRWRTFMAPRGLARGAA
ncbi:hypothetical protein [Gordonia sp. (in: high G+C Gram-positive bacteria)]|uniref:hypothetical protein n=1 Tax=Gordonia sp. (in: high G+C Gram-positive bacteria) TaxID=84139 RepID=UPI003526C7F8